MKIRGIVVFLGCFGYEFDFIKFFKEDKEEIKK